MKKTTRVLVALLALTLVTSCFVGGTFAKYITDVDAASDTARVANWGVEIAAIDAGAFNTQYNIEDTASGLTLAVKSSTTDKLVAPGTAGTFAGVEITGTPETAVKVTKTATVTLNDKWTTDGADFYCPIVVTVNSTPISGLDYTSATEFADAIKAAIETGSGYYEPLTDLAGVAGMNGDYAWEWAFDADGVKQTDAKDTILGDAAADGDAGTITIEVDANVVQVD